MADTGTGCVKPTYGRGVGASQQCLIKFDEDISCVVEAVQKTVKSIDFEKTFEGLNKRNIEDGSCDVSTLLSSLSFFNILSNTIDSCNVDSPVTLYGGFEVEGGVIAAGGTSYGVVYGNNGERGCFVSSCVGGGLTFGVAAGSFIGVLLSDSMSDLAGETNEAGADIQVVAGVGVTGTVSKSDPSIVGFEASAAVGAQVNFLTYKTCSTDVTTYRGD